MSCPGEASANLVQNVNGNEASALAPVVPLETEAAEYNDGNHKTDEGTSSVETAEEGEPDAAKGRKKNKAQKEKSSRTFVVPDNLIILESDSASRSMHLFAIYGDTYNTHELCKQASQQFNGQPKDNHP